MDVYEINECVMTVRGVIADRLKIPGEINNRWENWGKTGVLHVQKDMRSDGCVYD